MSFHAYQTTAAQAESPRETEYRLFGQVTRSLMAVADSDADLSSRAAALAWNRQIWSAMASDCADERNGLPDALRAGIISLALFVRRYSSEVLRDGAEMEPLIDINRTIMQGLQARPGAVSADPQAAPAA